MTVPAPFSQRPWHRRPNCAVIYDAQERPVSFQQNAEFLFGIEQVHNVLISKLKEMTDAYELAASLLGVPAGDIIALTGPARALLTQAKVAS